MPTPPVVVTKTGPPKLDIPMLLAVLETPNVLGALSPHFVSMLKETGYPVSIFKKVHLPS